MKKKVRILSLLLTALMVTGLSACGSKENRVEDSAQQNNTVESDQNTKENTAEASTTGEASQTEDQTTESEPGSESGDTLVVYFSRTGEQYTVGVIDKGNTAIVAVMIAEETGADLFEVIPDDGHDAPAYGIFSDRRVVP